MKAKKPNQFLDWLNIRLATIFWSCSLIDWGERPDSVGGGDFNPTFPGALPVNEGFSFQFGPDRMDC